MKKIWTSLLLLVIATTAFADAIVTEKALNMKTYPFSDPTPIADLNEPSKPIYPYFRFDGFSTAANNQDWNVVEIENDYVKVTVFPEIGGKIWSAKDKTTGEDFIYNNHVVKFRDIAMRGAWTSGGIELNFGIIGHVPTTATPIDYLIKQKEDGSASCYVSSYEWITDTWWMVEINLPADKAYFTTTTTWHNSSSLDQPYYQWMNAAYSADGNANFCFRGDHAIDHDGGVTTYPILNNGRDFSWYDKNNYGPDKSYHVLGAYANFYGIYWHNKNFGSVHYSPYTDKLGMKIFHWSHSRSGGIWEDLLTDSDGQYIELQSGRMFNQPTAPSGYTPFKHTAFTPQATDQWTEYWFPVKNIGGIMESSPLGALNVIRNDGKIQLLFSPLQKLNTELYVYEENKLIKTIPLQANVLETWTAMLPITELLKAPGHLKVVIGKNDLVYSEIKKDNVVNRPLNSPDDFNWNSVYGLFLQGEQRMNQKQYGLAEDYLQKALVMDSYFLPALQSLSTLYFRQGRYSECLDKCKTALSINTYDGKANYIYGLCNQALGNTIDAKDGFAIAARDVAVRSAAYEKLSEMSLLENELNPAEDFAKCALMSNDKNISAQQLLAIIYRKAGKIAEQQNLIKQCLQEYPLHHGMRYEAYLAGVITKDAFLEQIGNELPYQVYIEQSCLYERIKAYDEAIELLSCAENYPIANYKRAYILSKLDKENDALKWLQVAEQQSAFLVYPHRISSLPALCWAQHKLSTWPTRYYQALIYAANQQEERAFALLEQCNDATFAPLFLTRATLKNGKEKLADIQRAEQLEKSWRAGRALINYYNDNQEWNKAIEVGKKYLKLYPNNYYIGILYAQALCESGQYGACVGYMKKLQVLPYEGAKIGRIIYRNAYLLQAIDNIRTKHYKVALTQIEQSKIWLENLGAGKPYDEMIDDRVENYLQALAYMGLNEQKEALHVLEKVANYTVSHDNLHNSNTFSSAILCQALALSKLGNQKKADQIMASLPDEPVANWCKAIYNKQSTTSLENVSNNQDDDIKLLLRLFR